MRILINFYRIMCCGRLPEDTILVNWANNVENTSSLELSVIQPSTVNYVNSTNLSNSIPNSLYNSFPNLNTARYSTTTSEDYRILEQAYIDELIRENLNVTYSLYLQLQDSILADNLSSAILLI